MQMTQLTKLLLSMAISLLACNASADQLPVYAQGRAEIAYTSSKPTPEQKDQAVVAAKLKAIEAYFSEQNSAEARNFDAIEAQIKPDLDKYIVGFIVLGEEEIKDRKKYAVAIRAQLNTNRLADLMKPKATSPSSEKAELAFLFMARQVTSQKSFDDRVLKRVETAQSVNGQVAATEKTSEGESVKKSTVSTHASVDKKVASSMSTSASVETGGSTVKKAGEQVYKLGSNGTFNAAFLQVLNGQDWPYDPIEAETEPKLNLKKVKADFSTGDDIQPETLQVLIQDLKSAEFKYLALGTVDIGLPTTDAATGMTRVAVLLNAKIYDASGRRVKTIVTVEPVVINGSGADAAQAQANAIKLAATRAAKEFLNQLSQKNVH